MEGMELGQLARELFQGFQIDGVGLSQAVTEGRIEDALIILWEATWRTIGQPLELLKEYWISFVLLGIGAAFLKQLSLFSHAF